MNVVLSVSGLTVGHTQPNGRLILDDVSITLRTGECLCVIGDSGSGKTTLLRTIVGLLPTDLRQEGGKIVINGTVANKESIQSLWGDIVSVVFQDPHASLNPTLTIARQFEILLREKYYSVQLSNEEVKQETIRLLREVKITGPYRVLKKRPAELSSGMCQRINIALSLIKDPAILLLDEPTASLDYARRASILSLLGDIRKRRELSILFVTHDSNTVREIADRVVVLKAGKVIERVKRTSNDLIFLNETSKLLMSSSQLFAADKTSFGNDSNELLRISRISKFYDDQKVIEDISLSIFEHDRIGIVGESGGGKSTLAKVIAGYEAPSKGRVEARDGSRVELVLQDTEASVSPHHTVRAVLNEFRMITRRPLLTDKELYAQIGIMDLPRSILSKKVANISGGQRQRVVIARALLSQPDIIIFDEPTSALDASTQKKTLQFIKTMSKQFGFAYIIISHDMTVIEAMCERYITIKNGAMLE